MHPLIIVGGIALIGALVYAGGTARAALNLDYKFDKLQLHKITLTGAIFNLYMHITNMADTAIEVQMVSLTAYLNPSYVVDGNGKLKRITDNGSEIAQVNYNTPITIKAATIGDVLIKIEVNWLKLGLAVRNELQKIVNNGGAASVLIKGSIKCKGIIIPVEYVTTLNL